MNTALLIIGVHRSGTSAAARLVNLLGVELGPNLMPPAPDNNETGFWEHAEIVKLHDKVLDYLGRSWDDVRAIPDSELSKEGLKAFQDEIVNIISRDFGDSSLWGIKDPRICRLLPLWTEVFAETNTAPRYLFVVRHPLEVARSLVARDHFPTEKALHLWLRYMIDAERHSRGQERTFIAYEDLMGDWQRVLSEAAERLEMTWSRPLSEAAFEADRFLRNDLRHHCLGEALLEYDPVVPDWVRDAYGALTLATKGETEGLADTLSSIDHELLCADRLFAPTIKELKRDFKQLQEDGQNNIKNLQKAQRREINRLQKHYNREISQLRNHVDELKLELERANAQHIYELERRAQEITEIYASTSWRVSAPVRKLGTVLRQVKGMAARGLPRAGFDPRSLRHSGPLLGGDGNIKTSYKLIAQAELDQFLAGGHRLVLSHSEKPQVSIILVLWNQAALTFSCLRTIARSTEIATEVVIVDNASSDQTGYLLDRVEGAKIVRNSENLGFLHAVNQVAAKVAGAYILLLNNDAELLPGSLEAAVSTIEQQEDVGIVGGKIILLDGTLQEAGSIVWQDGTCSGYGRGEQPLSAPHMFRREVDYCSGAFLLVKRQLFEHLGGFDPAFAPAYYEETDLCFRARAKGYKTVYEPKASIIHYEFGSAPQAEQALEAQARNHRLFLQNHGKALEEKLPSSGGNVLEARMLPGHRSRILMIEDRPPHKDLGSGYPRSNDIICTLTELGHFVTLYPMIVNQETWPEVYRDIPRSVEVMIGWKPTQLCRFLEERKGYYDTVLVARPHNAEILLDVLKGSPGLLDNARFVYDAEAVFGMRTIERMRLAHKEVSDQEIQKILNDEIQLAKPADLVLTVSPGEAKLFRERGINRIRMLGHGIEPAPTPNGFNERSGILFVGAMPDDDSPNSDSIVWFVERVLPLIRRKLGDDVIVKIIGRNESSKVQSLASDSVRVLGCLEDLTDFYNASRLFIVPTRYAAGIPYKAHEAASRGLPIVGSSLIASQLGWANEAELLVANGNCAEEFAAACVRLYSDEMLWRRLRQNALSKLERECSHDAFKDTLASIFN